MVPQKNLRVMPKDKTFGSGKVMHFLIYELDTDMMEAGLPINSVKRCRGTIERILPIKKFTKDMNWISVISLLNFARKSISKVT